MSNGNLFNQISNFSANKSSSYIRTLPEYLNVRFPLSLTYTQARAKVKRVKSKEKYFKKSPIKFKLRHRVQWTRKVGIYREEEKEKEIFPYKKN